MRGSVDLRLMIAAALAVAGLACPKHTGTVTPGAPSPWEEWVIFDQPLERMILGAAWDGVGVPDTGCYAFSSDSMVGGAGWERYTLNWADTSSGALRLGVAKAFGFGASIAHAEQGEIRFAGLKSRFAANLGPTGNCIAARGGLPRYPAVYALIGADSLVFDLKSRSGAGVDAAVDFKRVDSGSVGFRTASNRGTTATFTSTRWVGARFLGLMQLDSVHDTLWTGYFPFNQFRPLRWEFEAKVIPVSAGDSTQPSGRFRVVVHRQIPLVWDTVLVDEGQTFAFGIPRTQVVRGEFFLGRAYTNAPNTAVQLRVERQEFKELRFDRNGQRDSLIRWSQRP